MKTQTDTPYPLRLLTAKPWRLANRHHCLLVVVTCFTALVALGEYSIGWYSVGGGGGTSSNLQYSISATIGRPDAGGVLSGGGYSLVGGFWAIYAVSTPGTPRLTIFVTRTNTVLVVWPSPSTGFGLQQNSGLNLGNWVTPLEPMNDDGVNRFIVVNPSSGERFYRLQHRPTH